MTTNSAVRELSSSISSYPDVNQLIINKNGTVALKCSEKGYVDFDHGNEVLTWLEDTYLDENGDLKN